MARLAVELFAPLLKSCNRWKRLNASRTALPILADSHGCLHGRLSFSTLEKRKAMERKPYDGMEIEVVRFDAEDVILTSGDDSGPGCDNVQPTVCESVGDAG